MTIPIYIGREKIQEVMVQLVQDATDTGRLVIKAKAVR